MVVENRDDAPAAAESTDRALRALADPTRRDILQVVLTGEASVSALAERYPMSFAAVQKHVAVLERAGLVTKRRHGREQLVSGDVDAIRQVRSALDRLEAIWFHRVAAMHRVLADDVAADTSADTATGPDHDPDPDPRSE